MALLKTVTKDSLVFHVFDTRAEGGALAAREGADVIRDLLSKQDKVNIIFAAAPSQNDTLSALLAEEGIDWSRVRAFHMDEYVGFGRECPQSFGTYLYDHVFGKLPFGEVYYINGAAEDPEEECRRYSELLTTYPTDIVFLGIGENAHIAFNDPWIADFNDPALVKLVPLDEVCRNQQVHDGCFPTLDDVPTHAFSLTVPALVKAKHMFCTVPDATKADAVKAMLCGEVTIDCPASILTTHADARLYTDRAAAQHIL